MVNDFPFPPPPDEPVPRDIKAKRIVPAIRKAPTVRSGKASIFTKASIPSVYWAGDDPTPLGNDEYTFYREGTPPPDEKGASRAARGVSLYDEEQRQRRERGQRRCCGLRMGVFWMLVGLIILVVLGVGIGVGVGVGVGVGNKASQQADGTATGTSSASATPTTPTSTSHTVTMTAVPTMSSTMTPDNNTATTKTDSATAATATTTATTLTTSRTSSSTSSASTPTATSSGDAICPDAGNTIYHVTGSDKRFLRLCGVEYSGDGEAIDMSNQRADSMGECMEACAKAAQCAGVSWGNVVTSAGTTELRCWLKRDLQKSHAAQANWNFAILL